MTVTVTISGPAKSGKTNLANLIHNALLASTNQHYDVNLIDEGKAVVNPHNKLLEVEHGSYSQYVIIEVENIEEAFPEDDGDDNDNDPQPTEATTENTDATTPGPQDQASDQQPQQTGEETEDLTDAESPEETQVEDLTE